MKNVNINRKIVVSISLTICILMIYTQPTIASIQASNLYEILRPIIIQLDDDETVVQASNDLQALIKDAIIMTPVSKLDLIKIEKKAISEVFLVGHGEPEGVQFHSNMLEWRELEKIIDQSPSFEHYLLSCYSSQIQSHPKVLRTFHGLVDVDIAILAIQFSRELVSLVKQEAPRESINQVALSHKDQMLELWEDKLENNGFQYLGTGWWRGLKWDKYPGTTSYPVYYDHLYRQRYSIDPDVEFEKHKPNNKIHVHQTPKHMMDLYMITEAIFYWIFVFVLEYYASLVIMALFTGVWVIVATAVVSFLLLLLGLSIDAILNGVLRDELGAVWSVVKDPKLNYLWFVPYSFQYYLKLGQCWYLNFEHLLTAPFNPIIYPDTSIPGVYVKNW
jgi:hypothetical protein